MQAQGVREGHVPPVCTVLVAGGGVHVVQGDVTRVITCVSSPSRGGGHALTVLSPRGWVPESAWHQGLVNHTALSFAPKGI